MRFVAIESRLPSQRVTNEDIIAEITYRNRPHMNDSSLKRLADAFRSLFQVAGTEVRYLRARDEKAHDFVMQAASAALCSARMSPSEIDLLIWVGVGRGFLEPATANVFQDALRLGNATCFDLLDACASWLRALHVAHAHIQNGDYRNVMILNGEFNFREYANFAFESIADLHHNFATFTIGEAATATIISADSEPNDDFYASFRNYGDAHKLCMIPLPNADQFKAISVKDHAKSLEFYSYSMELVDLAAAKLIEHFHAEKRIREFVPDIVFGHAASDSVVYRIAKRCNENFSHLYYLSHARFGNTVSASVPLAMSQAEREGRLSNGAKVGIAMASAGLSTGWSCFTYRR